MGVRPVTEGRRSCYKEGGKKAGEETEGLRGLDGEELRRKCARFAADHGEEIAQARPAIPKSLNDRAGDIWEPLLALADLAGGEWPEKARRAAESLSAGAQESSPSGALLLDIVEAFEKLKAERLFSREPVEELNGFGERPGAEGKSGKPVTELWLAQRLRPYGIRPRPIRLAWEVGRGYARADFTEAFRRYVPAGEAERRRAERIDEDPSMRKLLDRCIDEEVERVMAKVGRGQARGGCRGASVECGVSGGGEE